MKVTGFEQREISVEVSAEPMLIGLEKEFFVRLGIPKEVMHHYLREGHWVYQDLTVGQGGYLKSFDYISKEPADEEDVKALECIKFLQGYFRKNKEESNLPEWELLGKED